VTLLAAGDAVSLALAAAAEEDAEVVDLRSLQPLDTRTIGESVRRTGRAIAIGPSAPLLVALNEAFLHLESPLACVPPTAGHDALVRAIRECVRY
jgi:pyruvate/2-oxoglutarate/acetoin dehydrogenase E1 component